MGDGVQSLKGKAVLDDGKESGAAVVGGVSGWPCLLDNGRTWGCEEDQPGPLPVLTISLRMDGTPPIEEHQLHGMWGNGMPPLGGTVTETGLG